MKVSFTGARFIDTATEAQGSDDGLTPLQTVDGFIGGD